MPERAVNVTTPQNGKVFTYSLKLPTIALVGLKMSFHTSYKVEIARNQDFTNMVKTLDSFENYISTDIPSKGTYYIRITTRPSIPDLSPVVSPVSQFSVEERQVPNPPEIISPVANSSFGVRISFKEVEFF